eukprot:4541780-Pleurochrysis_carterae.AAC.2
MHSLRGAISLLASSLACALTHPFTQTLCDAVSHQSACAHCGSARSNCRRALLALQSSAAITSIPAGAITSSIGGSTWNGFTLPA